MYVRDTSQPFVTSDGTEVISLDACEKVFNSRGPLPLTRQEIYKLTETTYLRILRSPLLPGPNPAIVTIQPVLKAIKTVIQAGAGDDVLERMSVVMLGAVRAPEELDSGHPNTMPVSGIQIAPCFYHLVYRNYDGNYVKATIFISVPLRTHLRWVRPISQREAIVTSVTNADVNERSSQVLRALGIDAFNTAQ